MKVFFRSLTLLTLWLGTTPAFADLLIQSTQPNLLISAGYCRCGLPLGGNKHEISIEQRISNNFGRLTDVNLGAPFSTSLANGDFLPFASLEQSLIRQKTLTVFMTAGSIPEPALLLLLGVSLLGIAGLIHVNTAHKRRPFAREAEQ